jgi:ABC-2 type transport system permease protein
MKSRVIGALLKKDLALFVSNRFYLLITIVGLVFYVGIYFILPAHAEEKLKLAMYAPVIPPAFSQITENDGTDIKFLSSEEGVKQAVLHEDYQVAIALPPDVMEIWSAGSELPPSLLGGNSLLCFPRYFHG